MRHTYVIETSLGRRLASMMAPAAFVLLVLGPVDSSVAQQVEPRTFSSPGEASRALFDAVRNHDEPALEAILGAGHEVTSSGDENTDKLEREQFARKYQEMHRLVLEPDGTTVLYIGPENWPFPVPLTSRNGRWSFDSSTGAEEILFRRIGQNEATAIEVCRDLVRAEQQAETQADPIREYARRLVGARTADAGGTVRGNAEREPFEGYHFRAVTEQPGLTAVGTTGGRASGSRQIVDVAFVAYPVEYRSSGVMTFIVTKDGAVYERDLGPDTQSLARDIQERAPTSGWRAVQ